MKVESMKTLPLKDVLKLATPGKLTADYMRVYTNDGEFWIASTDTPGPATDEEATANAALLAHKWNHFDDLIEALERCMEWYSREGTMPPKETLERVLKRAMTVEMP